MKIESQREVLARFLEENPTLSEEELRHAFFEYACKQPGMLENILEEGLAMMPPDVSCSLLARTAH